LLEHVGELSRVYLDDYIRLWIALLLTMDRIETAKSRESDSLGYSVDCKIDDKPVESSMTLINGARVRARRDIP